MSGTGNKKRISLVRIGGYQKQNVNNKIQKNLPSGNVRLLKAQESYYNSGISPMSLHIKKEPVHNRLGIKGNHQRNRVQFFGTNTSNIMPKWKRNKANARLVNLRKKLELNRNLSNTNQRQNNGNNHQFFNNTNHRQNNGNNNNFFKLRRDLDGVGDLTIQVANNTSIRESNCECGIRHQIQLNPRLQNLIKKLQPVAGRMEGPINMRMASFATSTSINERISTCS